jgi:hypothetical protein
MEFHHVGIPTTKQREGESYLEGGKLYVTDAGNSEHKIEWLRFEDASPMPELLKTTAHVAFKVDDVAKASEGKQVLLEPFHPMEGVTGAFIVADGAPIEFMQVAD